MATSGKEPANVIISIYKNINDASSTETVHLDSFLEAVQSGKWQDEVFKIRLIKDHDERQIAKKKLQYVTISGVFTNGRSAAGLSAHSGYISIDLDNLADELEGFRTLLANDPYIYACFTSASGTGLCAVIKIDPERHLDAFNGIASYFLNQYQLVVDPSGKDVSRARYVSYDPELVKNDRSATFRKYLPKEKARKIQATIFVQDEFDRIISEMVAANISCVEDYRDWLEIGFGLADKFGETGRQYFHALSSVSAKYEQSICDRQYTYCLRGNGRSGAKITIATIYWHAKQAGIQVHSEKTRKVAAATSAMKKAGLDATTVAKNLEKFEGITGVDDIIKQAMQTSADFSGDETLVENIRMWLRHNFDLKRNLITRKIENSNIVLEEVDFNTMFLDAKIQFDALDYKLFERVILSNNTPSYNPIKDFINAQVWDGVPRISKLAECINSITGDPIWRERMLMKWIVGIIHSINGGWNELNFILVGGKNTGKTEFFRQILPEPLRIYFAGSQLNRGTDDEILMCEKLIIFNDEYGGKNRADERNEKRLMAAPDFTLRVPYGHHNVTVKRLASLCGTCNELDVLDDATGNRRIIVMESAGKFNYELYNEIDKTQVLMEAIELWKQGERPVLKDVDIVLLEAVTDGEYSKVSFEEEMVQKWFKSPESSSDYMTTTDIKNELELHTKDKISIHKLGARLRKLGYERLSKGGRYVYKIEKIASDFGSNLLPEPLPF